MSSKRRYPKLEMKQVESAFKKLAHTEKKVAPRKAPTTNIEMKFFDVLSDFDGGISPAVGDTTSAVIALNDVPQGDDRNQRTGRKIHLHDLTLTYNVTFTTTNSPAANTHTARFRVVVFIDQYGDGITAPTPDLVYVLDGHNGSPNIDMWSLRNMDQPERFKVIMDDHVPFECAYNAGTRTQQFKKVIPLSKRAPYNITSYSGSTATANKNRMYIFFVCDQPTLAASAFTPLMRIYSRIHFTDV